MSNEFGVRGSELGEIGSQLPMGQASTFWDECGRVVVEIPYFVGDRHFWGKNGVEFS